MTSEIKEKMDCLEDDVGVEEDEEDIEEEEDDEEEEGDESVTHGRRSGKGRGLTLKTLLKEKILLPGLGNLSINYLGNIFKGDLMSDGRIRSQETGKIFGTPSAWAIFCKQIVNPNKKSGCGWASVKYRGKKLDEYKNNWNRQKRLEFEREGDDIECDDDAGSCSESDGSDPFDHEVIEFDMLHTRHDAPYTGNPLIELSSFASLGRLQPFTVAASSSAMAVVDLHVHITRGEAVGFLAGQWDVNNHNLIVSHAFPLCWDNPHSNCSTSTNNNSSTSPNMVAGQAAEEAIHKQMASLKLALVGWYHSHPHSAPLPSLRDVDCQLDYEMKMKGSNDASYTPCIGFIVSPFHEPKSSGRRNSSLVSQTPKSQTDDTDSDQKLADGEKNTEKKDIKSVTPMETDVKGGDNMTASLKEPMKSEVPPSSVPLKIDTSVVPTVPPHLKTLTPMNCYWVMPPSEHRPHEYPRPMSVIYNVVQDAFVPKEALIHMRECVKFYSNSDEGIDLHTTYDSTGITYWDKLKGSIKARVPRDHYVPLIEYLHKILRIKLPLPELSQPLSPLPVKEEKMDMSVTPTCKGKEQIKTDIVGASHSPSNSRSPHPASVNTLTETRSRPYPDPSKIHPLLVDKSDERTLQPLILPSKSLPSDKSEENKAVHIHQILTDVDSKTSDKTSDVSSTSLQSGNSQNPPDYPFPLLRGMVAEQTSVVQRQQEQRVEKQSEKVPLDKEGDKQEERHTVSITMTEKAPPRDRGSPPPYSTLPPYPSFPSDLSKKEPKKSDESSFSALGLLTSKPNTNADVITPSLSSSPLSLPFYAPQSGAITPQPPLLPPSPAPSVEVSPRHTEWAQNALSGMSRPPIISVKSQASLLNPPTTTTPPSPALTSTTPGNDIHPTVPSMSSLTESLTSSAANPWLQASFPGLAQFQAFNPSQFGKASAAEQSAAAAAFSAYHAASLLQQQSTGAAAEQYLMQHQQEQQRKQ